MCKKTKVRTDIKMIMEASRRKHRICNSRYTEGQIDKTNDESLPMSINDEKLSDQKRPGGFERNSCYDEDLSELERCH